MKEERTRAARRGAACCAPTYRQYKDSGVEWLGKVPEHWEVLPLFATMTERQEKNSGNKVQDVLSLSYGRIIPRDVESNFGLLPESFETYQIVLPNNLILRLTDLQNDKRSLRVGLARQKGIITSAYVCLQTLEELDSNFAYHLLHSYDLGKVFYGLGGGVRQSMKFSDLKRLTILLPPLPEQRAIASYLDRETARLDELISRQQRLIELSQEKRRALIGHAVTRGLDEKVLLKDSGVEWLGKVPKHWEVLPLFALMSERQEKNSGNIVQKVLSLSYGRIIPRDVESNFGLLPKSFETYQIVLPGNIILRLTDLQNDKRSLRVGLVEEKGIITSAYVCLRCASRIETKFTYLLLHSYDIDKVFYGLGGGVRQSMKYSDLKHLPILLPPLPEQHAIVKYLETETTKIDTLITKAQRAIALMQERRSALIAAAVTGQIDVREIT